MSRSPQVMPSEVNDHLSLFDRFATWTEGWVSRAVFFLLCVLMVVVWFPTLFFMPIDSSQLIINTTTTIITFLLVALLQNTQKRSVDAQQKKLNAIADALAYMLREGYEGGDREANELCQGIGLERREST